MSIMNRQGRLNIFGWRINIIDFCVLLFGLCLIAIFPFTYRVMNKKPEVAIETLVYTINRSCPVCGWSAKIEIPKGELLPEYYETICFCCGNKVALLDTRPVPVIEPPPPPPPPPKPTDWEYMLYEWLYKNKEILFDVDDGRGKE